MPELPEVETVANGVHQRVRGEVIESVWLGSKPEPFKTRPDEIAEALTGRTIERGYRIGKHIVFDLDDEAGPQWIVHLGMTGRLLVSAGSVAVPAHTHAILRLA